MTVDTISKNKIKISLTDDEIITFFGSYDLIDYKYPAAKKMLNLLLREALPDEMLPIDCKKVLIEVKPEAGGCAIYFTKIYENTQKRLRKINQTKSFALIFQSSNDLIDFIKNLDVTDINTSGLYISNGCYTLLIGVTKAFLAQLTHISEYCEITDDKTVLSNVLEHGTPICCDNAAVRLKDAFKKP